MQQLFLQKLKCSKLQTIPAMSYDFRHRPDSPMEFNLSDFRSGPTPQQPQPQQPQQLLDEAEVRIKAGLAQQLAVALDVVEGNQEDMQHWLQQLRVELQQQRDEKQRQQDEMRQQRDEMQQQREEMQRQREEMQRQRDEMQQQRDEMQQQRDKLQRQHCEMRDDLRILKRACCEAIHPNKMRRIDKSQVNQRKARQIVDKRNAATVAAEVEVPPKNDGICEAFRSRSKHKVRCKLPVIRGYSRCRFHMRQ
jgi:septal ring factor EnvC (AmiA/AmiB activator)